MELVETPLDFFKDSGKIREYCFLNHKPTEKISVEEAKKLLKN